MGQKLEEIDPYVDGRKFIVVAGGFNNDTTPLFARSCSFSVELLDITSSSIKWKKGKDFLDF